MVRKFTKALCLIREGRYKELFYGIEYHIARIWYLAFGYHKMLEAMRQDARFMITDDFLAKALKWGIAERFELCELRLDDAKSSNGWRPHMIPLSETETFGYIVNGDEESYREYLRISLEHIGMDSEIITAKIEARIALLPETVASIMRNGYDITKGAVVIDNDNVVIDGLHRCAILWRQFGGKHMLPAVRISYKRRKT